MPAYIIADVAVHDPERYRAYTARMPASIAPYGGRFVVRGGDHTVLEGTWRPGRLVLIEFPDVERAREWYDSDGYTELKAIRQEAATAAMLLVEGVPE
jgi:uncharacterized protein (DUF1330 family)